MKKVLSESVDVDAFLSQFPPAQVRKIFQGNTFLHNVTGAVLRLQGMMSDISCVEGYRDIVISLAVYHSVFVDSCSTYPTDFFRRIKGVFTHLKTNNIFGEVERVLIDKLIEDVTRLQSSSRGSLDKHGDVWLFTGDFIRGAISLFLKSSRLKALQCLNGIPARFAASLSRYGVLVCGDKIFYSQVDLSKVQIFSGDGLDGALAYLSIRYHSGKHVAVPLLGKPFPYDSQYYWHKLSSPSGVSNKEYVLIPTGEHLSPSLTRLYVDPIPDINIPGLKIHMWRYKREVAPTTEYRLFFRYNSQGTFTLGEGHTSRCCVSGTLKGGDAFSLVKLGSSEASLSSQLLNPIDLSRGSDFYRFIMYEDRFARDINACFARFRSAEYLYAMPSLRFTFKKADALAPEA